MSQGPIIQPRLVGQATTSPGWMSWWKWPSIAALTGVSWVHGIAFGSPVVPDEKSTLVTRSGSPGTGSNSSAPPPSTRSAHHRSPRRSRIPAPVSTATARSAPASTTLSYMGRWRPARVMRSWVTTKPAPAMRSRAAISSGAKLSAIDTTAPPRATTAR